MTSPLIVITGAGGGLGRVLAESFLEQGARVALVDISKSMLTDVFGEETDSRFHVGVDLTNFEQCEREIGRVVEAHGPVGVLCNLAGGFFMGTAVHETEDVAWRRLIELNVATVINASKVIVPSMKASGKGKVINVSAVGALRGEASFGPYSAAKSAVARLTESMAAELREHGVNVNAVAPSVIATDANKAAMPDADSDRWVSPKDLCQVIHFLASDNARAIHGAVIPVVGLS